MGIHIVTIIDQNSFDAVLLKRAFTDFECSRTWASHQLIAIRRSLADAGEDLLDIEAKFNDYPEDGINDPEPVIQPASHWRRS